MASRNALREYHLLIVRREGGFSWEIRYNRHAKPVRIGDAVFSHRDKAQADGDIALRALRDALLPQG